jgi:hypothetical protein
MNNGKYGVGEVRVVVVGGGGGMIWISYFYKNFSC